MSNPIDEAMNMLAAALADSKAKTIVLEREVHRLEQEVHRLNVIIRLQEQIGQA